MKYHKSGFKSIGKLVLPLIKRFGQLDIISCAKLLNVWESVVGEDISKKAYPIKIETIRGGKKSILHLGMTGPYMAQLSLQKQDIIERINSYYSREVIVQIKLQRLHNNNEKKLLELENAHSIAYKKNEEPNDPKLYVVHLEYALSKMKSKLSKSRKKNENM